MRTADKQLPDWTLIAACVLPFLGFWAYGLFDLDEGFYGAVVVDMIRRGDWITPTLNGVPWFEKPILAYWLAIPSVQLFGEAFGPRLPSVLCTLATVLVLYRFVRDYFGVGPARLTAVVYSTNLLVVAIGRMMMTDAPLVLCLTLAMTTFWRSLCTGSDGSESKSLRLWSALFVGVGVLAKGPVAAILFFGVVGFAYWLIPSLRPKFRGYWLMGIGIALATVAVWYVPCYLLNGTVFIDKFLIEQNVGRFAGGDKAHSVPLWSHPIYFPLILLLSFLPWTLLVKWSKSSSEVNENLWATRRFLWIWGLVPLVFFTISGTKLPHYILPAVAPLAALVSLALLASRPRWPLEKIGLGWVACVLVLAQFAFTTDWQNRMREVQEAAKIARAEHMPLYVYKVGGSGDTSVSLQIRETSHPSILYYYGGSAVTTDDSSAWAGSPGPYYILAPVEVAESDPALAEMRVTQGRANGKEKWVVRKWLSRPDWRRYVLVYFGPGDPS